MQEKLNRFVKTFEASKSLKQRLQTVSAGYIFSANSIQ